MDCFQGHGFFQRSRIKLAENLLKAESSGDQTYQVDGSLVEARGLQDLLHGDSLQLVWVQLLPLVRYAVVHDHRQWAHPSLLIVRSTFLEKKMHRDATFAASMLSLYNHYVEPLASSLSSL